MARTGVPERHYRVAGAPQGRCLWLVMDFDAASKTFKLQRAADAGLRPVAPCANGLLSAILGGYGIFLPDKEFRRGRASGAQAFLFAWDSHGRLSFFFSGARRTPP